MIHKFAFVIIRITRFIIRKLRIIYKWFKVMLLYGYNPYKIIWVSPDKINYITPASQLVDRNRHSEVDSVHCSTPYRGYFIADEQIGNLIDGDWDLPRIRVENMPEYQALEDMLIHNKNWGQTLFVSQILAYMKKGNAAYGYSDENKFKIERRETIKTLANSIAEKGVIPTTHNPFLSRYFDNVTVNIARDGRILFQGGHHRFCIAKILKLKAIPVVIIVKHMDWVNSVSCNNLRSICS